MSFEKDKYIGYVEMALGVGDMIGPAIGGFVFDFTGFVGTFLAFGGMIFIGIVFCIIMIP
jgi:MFS family permease